MSLRRTLAYVCAWKLFSLAIPLGLWLFAPWAFRAQVYVGSFPGSDPTTLAARYSTWDSHHYLELVERGYRAGEPSSAMYPLFPALIRAADPLGAPVPIGLALSQLCFLCGCALLYWIVEARHGARAASASVLALAAYPGSCFYGLIYTEALFLVLSLALFFCIERGRHGWAAAAGFLLPLTRTVGVLAILPLACTFWERRHARAQAAGTLLVASSVAAGCAAYFGWLHLATGNALEGIEAQAFYVSEPSFAKLVDPLGFLAELFTVKGVLSFRGGFIDRVVFASYAALLIPIWRTCTRGEFLWALGLGFVPAAAVSFMSFTRYTSVIFPLFIVVGVYLARPENARVAGGALRMSLLFQLLLLGMHASSFWVG